MKATLLFFLLFVFSGVFAQETYPLNRTSEIPLETVLYTNAHIQVSYDKVIENGALLVEKGIIKEIFEEQPDIKGVPVIDLQNAWIYSAFIDLYSDYGMPEPDKKVKERKPQFISDKKGAYYWNASVHPEISASSHFHVNAKTSETLMQFGFGLVLTHQQDGIVRGTATLANTAGKNDLLSIKKRDAATVYSFYKGTETQDYPSSQMGSVALIRQAFYDAKWYSSQKEEFNLSLEALNKHSALPKLFEVRDVQEIFRVLKIADEFGFNFIIKATGHEYRWVDELVKQKEKLKLVLPLNFDKAPRVSNPLETDMIPSAQLYDFYYSPHNAKILNQEGISFCFTADGLKKKEDFFQALQTLLQSGLTESEILKALTHTPAEYLGMPTLGKITKGEEAQFFIADGSIFEDNTRIHSFVNKDRLIPSTNILSDGFVGTFRIEHEGNTLEFNIEKPLDKPVVKSLPGNPSIKFVKIEQDNSMVIKIENQLVQLTLVSGRLNAFSMSGNSVYRQVLKRLPYANDSLKNEKDSLKTPPVKYSMDYSYAQRDSNTFFISNATIWTCEEAGIIEGGSVYVRAGKIVAIGADLSVPKGVRVIDGTGMHLTPGIIDEHSHIAIYRGVNEGTQAVTSEVRIGDVLNAEDINIYRQLAGGVTVSHLLHGSANPVGGQTELIKMRYGSAPEGLKFSSDFRFIKFALGENVKQSNWGDHQRVRYPQTRMGVEQVFADAFTRALAYRDNKSPGKRKDLELEALVEILEGKRFITCHSYQQGEINMLIELADSFNFKVNTFTHILEGYKVADKLREHGAAASTFADWWAYKYEVIDAIPYNAALLTDAGVLTGINSDDAEMGRRLNHEAAKTIKYGGMSEIEALKMITLNPAKMLHIDDRVGSIKVGKDADLVLWTSNPLSIYALVEFTFVDGVIYYSRTLDTVHNQDIAKRRAQMLEQLKQEKQEAAPRPDNNRIYHCDDHEIENN